MNPTHEQHARQMTQLQHIFTEPDQDNPATAGPLPPGDVIEYPRGVVLTFQPMIVQGVGDGFRELAGGTCERCGDDVALQTLALVVTHSSLAINAQCPLCGHIQPVVYFGERSEYPMPPTQQTRGE